GTSTWLGPEETTSATLLPAGASSPSPGVEEDTMPASYSLDGAVETSPTSKPASLSACLAASSVWPTTEGTSSVSGPAEMYRVTASSGPTSVPASGSVRVAWPSS